MRPKQRPDWAHVAVALVHLLVSLSHTLVTRRALALCPAPALAAFQLATVAASLWFWSLFGLFRVRVLSWLPVATLALPHALLCLCGFVLLARGSLALYVAVRVAPVAFERARMLCALCVLLMLAADVVERLVVAALVLYVLAARTLAFVTARCAHDVVASELQLALFTKSLSALLLLAPALYATDSHALDVLHAQRMSVMTVCASTLLAFANFVSTRALISRCEQRMADVTLLATMFPLLLWFFSEAPYDNAACLILASCLFVLALDAVRRKQRTLHVYSVPTSYASNDASTSATFGLHTLALSELV